jgi:lipopolysaccharide export system protein LptC
LTNGTLSSDRLRITGGGEVIRFEGNVVMHLDNLDTAAATPDPSATAEAAPIAPEPSPARPAKARASSSKSVNPK